MLLQCTEKKLNRNGEETEKNATKSELGDSKYVCGAEDLIEDTQNRRKEEKEEAF